MTDQLDLGVCTFRRTYVGETLKSLRAMHVPDALALRIFVLDNDDEPSAADLVDKVAREPGTEITYVHVPGRNISIARNALLERSEADWIAFIDDDETVVPAWLSEMWARHTETGTDGVFGAMRSLFPPEAPDWLRVLNLHSPGAQRIQGRVETGGAGNVLLRWRNTPWQGERFDLRRGRTGGEDTEFFFRLRRMGARYEIADAAIAFEPVAPERMSLHWLIRRRFRAGQSYSARSVGQIDRASLALQALGKSGLSLVMVVPQLFSPAGWRFWLLRSSFHAGVVAGCLNIREVVHYG